MNKRRAGMYGETPRIQIGEFSICRQDPDGEDKSVWIEKEDGEGSEFSDKDVAENISIFFEKNF